MSPADVVAARALAAAGHGVQDIAAQLGRSRFQIRRALARATPREFLEENGLVFAKAWLRAAKVSAGKGKHEPAKEALEAIGAVEVVGAGSGTMQVNVGVALPGAGAPLS